MSADADSRPSADIVVVDDTPANLELLVDLLSTEGYRVRPVADGGVALKAIRHRRPDLILLDVTMPGLSGFDICRRLKADEATRDIPVLFVSALTSSQEKVAAFAAGGVDYVTKPFHAEEVISRVRTHLELSRSRLALARNLAELRRLEELRDSLTHMIAHDMRSPLLALALGLELLDQPPGHPDPQMQEMVREGRTAVGTLVDMVSQMLEVSRLESAQLPLALADVELGPLVEAVVARLRPGAGARAFLFEAPEAVTARVDPGLLRRVLENLVGNALKYSPAPGLITVKLARAGERAIVEVVDEGPGIEPEYQSRIFEKFGQVSAGDAKRGFGIGLAFVRLAIEAHGGTVGVRSAPARGSTFFFSVPLAGPLPAAPAP